MFKTFLGTIRPEQHVIICGRWLLNERISLLSVCSQFRSAPEIEGLLVWQDWIHFWRLWKLSLVEQEHGVLREVDPSICTNVPDCGLRQGRGLWSAAGNMRRGTWWPKVVREVLTAGLSRVASTCNTPGPCQLRNRRSALAEVTVTRDTKQGNLKFKEVDPWRCNVATLLPFKQLE